MFFLSNYYYKWRKRM